MMRMKHLLAAATLSLVISGCSSNKNVVFDKPFSEVYDSAQKNLHKSNYKSAIKDLEELDNCYSFGPYAQQVQLDLIYAYYKSTDFPLAQASINRFLRLYPTHPNIDYVLYIRGLIDMALEESALQGFLGVDYSDRNPEHAYAAFRNFKLLIQNYPNQQYSMDAIKRLIYLKGRLAKHELSIVKYYNKRGAYIAVANRVEQMLRNFPDTEATRQALPYMEKAYRKLQLNGQAKKVIEIIASNSI